MAGFLGEFECKVDTKCRVALPAALKRQLPEDAAGRFVLNRGFERHLSLYPFPVWEQVTAELNKLNPFVKKNREFLRYFHRGASEVELDSAGRLLLPKRLLDYAEITADMILLAYGNRIEIWNPEVYDAVLDVEPEHFADLAEDIFGEPPAPSYDEASLDDCVIPIIKRTRKG